MINTPNWIASRELHETDVRRWVYNWIMLSREFTVLRKSPEQVWLGELPREPFNQVLRDLEHAFNNFFAKRAAYPEFKSRRCRASVRFTLDQRRVQVHHGGGRWALLDLPGLGQPKCRCTFALTGRLRSATLSRDAAGRINVSITADGVPTPVHTAPAHTAIGIDAGLRDLAVSIREPPQRPHGQDHAIGVRNTLTRGQSETPTKQGYCLIDVGNSPIGVGLGQVRHS